MIEVLYGGTPCPIIASAQPTIGSGAALVQLHVELSGVVPFYVPVSPTQYQRVAEVFRIWELRGELPTYIPILKGLETNKVLAARLFDDEGGYNLGVPGMSYIEQAPLQYKRAMIDFKKFEMLEARVVVTAQGDEAGAGKGVEIYDQTGGAQLCEVTWTGATLQQALAGSWTNSHKPNSDRLLLIRVKGSSATEAITLYAVTLQLIISEQDIPP